MIRKWFQKKESATGERRSNGREPAQGGEARRKAGSFDPAVVISAREFAAVGERKASFEIQAPARKIGWTRVDSVWWRHRASEMDKKSVEGELKNSVSKFRCCHVLAAHAGWGTCC